MNPSRYLPPPAAANPVPRTFEVGDPVHVLGGNGGVFYVARIFVNGYAVSGRPDLRHPWVMAIPSDLTAIPAGNL